MRAFLTAVAFALSSLLMSCGDDDGGRCVTQLECEATCIGGACDSAKCLLLPDDCPDPPADPGEV